MPDELGLSVSSIEDRTTSLAKRILDEENLDAVKDLTHLFNLNQAKKNVIRIMKLSGLLDTVSDRIVERFEKYPDNFSNADLLNYLQVTQNALEKANKNLNMVDDTPTIRIQQNNQVNVSIVDSYDRDSRERILEYLKSVLTAADNDTTEQYVELIEEEVDEDEQ